MDLERFTDSPRWPVVVDCVLAAVVLGLQLLGMYFIDGLRDYFTWEVALEVSACAALLLRRRFPVLVLVWVLAVALVHDWGLYYGSTTAFPHRGGRSGCQIRARSCVWDVAHRRP